MPTRSDLSRPGEWTARTDKPKRSVFENYSGCDSGSGASSVGEPEEAPRIAGATAAEGLLQAAIDLAVARSFIHRFLAAAFEDPKLEHWPWLCDADTRRNLRSAWAVVSRGAKVEVSPADELAETAEPFPVFARAGFESFLEAYVGAFGHAARGACPLNEIEYGDIKADPLFQPHRLADLAAFYRAFGLEVAGDAGERHDHLCLELEFMCVLAAKEAYALENQLDADELSLCRDAQKKFLREHLGRWTPAFAGRLAAATAHPWLRSLARVLGRFIQLECARFSVSPGSEDLLLRPVEEATERMCEGCGLANLPPGALAAT